MTLNSLVKQLLTRPGL